MERLSSFVGNKSWHGHSLKTITKLPTISPTLQYIEHNLPPKRLLSLPETQPQRVIMKIGDPASLFEKVADRVIEAQLTEVKTQGKIFKFDGDLSKVVPISKAQAQKFLAPNKQGAEFQMVVDAKTEVNSLVTEIKTRHKYEPLSHRTKTLKDIEDKLIKRNYIEAEIFERKIEEKCKAQPSRFLKIDMK